MGKFAMLKKHILQHYKDYSGWMLEKYFRQKFAEDEDVTAVGNYWDNADENEIDLIAINRFDKTAIVGEVKRNAKKISLPHLQMKISALKKPLLKYQISFVALSLDDM